MGNRRCGLGHMRFILVYMDVSENSGFSPQIIHGLIGVSIINHAFWGTPIFGNTHILVDHRIHKVLLDMLRQDKLERQIWR